ncbi:MAG: hypothetical protein CVV50_00100 [Spirochaetae bacterium HGW-Spirochaetae-6]|nr:MAG: hypothetical protein CVV50_00100 [Spirochaetae bacterium HGW-Spirochaetae-6]
MAQIMSFMNLDKGTDIKGYQAMDLKKDSREEKDPLPGERSFAKALEKVSEKINEREREVPLEKEREILKERTEIKDKDMRPEAKSEGAQKNALPEKVLPIKEETVTPKIKEIQNQIKKILGQWQKAGLKPEAVKKITEKLQKGMKLDEMIKELEHLISLLSQGMASGHRKESEISPNTEKLIKEIKADLAQLKGLAQSVPDQAKSEIKLLMDGSIEPKSDANKEKKSIYQIKVSAEVKELKEREKTSESSQEKFASFRDQKPETAIKARELKAKLQGKSEPLSAKIGKSVEQETTGSPKTALGEGGPRNLNAPFSSGSEVRFGEFDKTLSAMKKNLEKADQAQMGKQILDQIGEKVRGFVGKDSSHITIDLKPEALGKVKIILDMKQGEINGKILVENPEVKELLKDHLVEVRSILEAKGIQLADFEVSSQGGEGFREQMAEDQLQKTIALNRKVGALLSRMDTYTQNMEDYLELSNQAIYLQA